MFLWNHALRLKQPLNQGYFKQPLVYWNSFSNLDSVLLLYRLLYNKNKVFLQQIFEVTECTTWGLHSTSQSLFNRYIIKYLYIIMEEKKTKQYVEPYFWIPYLYICNVKRDYCYHVPVDLFLITKSITTLFLWTGNKLKLKYKQ